MWWYISCFKRLDSSTFFFEFFNHIVPLVSLTNFKLSFLMNVLYFVEETVKILDVECFEES